MTTYYDELARAMEMLGRDERVVFLGQSVKYPGTKMTDSLLNVPPDKLIEMPVAEDMQLGMCIGLSLAGKIPVSIFPRWNFLLLAANQLVNHLDRLPIYSGYRPHVIIRVAAPAKSPLDPQAQHDGDFTDQFEAMCKTVNFLRLDNPFKIMPGYRGALNGSRSTVLVEYVARYDDE